MKIKTHLQSVFSSSSLKKTFKMETSPLHAMKATIELESLLHIGCFFNLWNKKRVNQLIRLSSPLGCWVLDEYSCWCSLEMRQRNQEGWIHHSTQTSWKVVILLVQLEHRIPTHCNFLDLELILLQVLYTLLNQKSWPRSILIGLLGKYVKDLVPFYNTLIEMFCNFVFFLFGIRLQIIKSILCRSSFNFFV